jgi:hypothetical protein
MTSYVNHSSNTGGVYYVICEEGTHCNGDIAFLFL